MLTFIFVNIFGDTYFVPAKWASVYSNGDYDWYIFAGFLSKTHPIEDIIYKQSFLFFKNVITKIKINRLDLSSLLEGVADATE